MNRMMILLSGAVLSVLFGASICASSQYPQWRAKVDEFRQFKGHAEIVMFGDSLTANGNWQEMFPKLTAINRGISGERVDSALLRLGEITAARPRLVFIMLGVNDIRRSVSPDRVAASYGRIIDRLAVVDAIVVQSTLFTSDVAFNAAIKRLNGSLAARCSQAANCRFLDLNAALSRNDLIRPEFTTDGIHLNGDGYRAWEHQIRPMMAAIPTEQ
ncbi:GDSL-type esterase/lipase family protein [Mesorhizobium sp. STM 4661]|uniref:GDSL-type esterase/lipase family protein n=1 Tax=Mesorhizobium sp. STM 4661 TaxID=1297570 RepID=UPI0002BF8715|nr:GDSL-type esterase/lipase family protein [Mesorhizobium sp. STM 4661]CCV12466.1 exported hypothetical protein [Mesorhizobium sp. STM 4661]